MRVLLLQIALGNVHQGWLAFIPLTTRAQAKTATQRITSEVSKLRFALDMYHVPTRVVSLTREMLSATRDTQSFHNWLKKMVGDADACFLVCTQQMQDLFLWVQRGEKKSAMAIDSGIPLDVRRKVYPIVTVGGASSRFRPPWLQSVQCYYWPKNQTALFTRVGVSLPDHKLVPPTRQKRSNSLKWYGNLRWSFGSQKHYWSMHIAACTSVQSNTPSPPPPPHSNTQFTDNFKLNNFTNKFLPILINPHEWNFSSYPVDRMAMTFALLLAVLHRNGHKDLKKLKTTVYGSALLHLTDDSCGEFSGKEFESQLFLMNLCLKKLKGSNWDWKSSLVALHMFNTSIQKWSWNSWNNPLA